MRPRVDALLAYAVRRRRCGAPTPLARSDGGRDCLSSVGALAGGKRKSDRTDVPPAGGRVKSAAERAACHLAPTWKVGAPATWRAAGPTGHRVEQASGLPSGRELSRDLGLVVDLQVPEITSEPFNASIEPADQAAAVDEPVICGDGAFPSSCEPVHMCGDVHACSALETEADLTEISICN